jgi:thiamine-phosphate pyrophosphorylase
MDSMSVLPSPLYVICDAEVCARSGWSLVDFASACLDGGARLLQIRAKAASGQALLDATTAIVRRAASVQATVIVNDRADVARMAGASGVHVGQTDMAPADVHAVAGAQAIVGLSTHTPEQVHHAVHEPVSYLAIGPVFSTVTKATGYDAVGLALVREAAAIAGAAGLPVVAIGGITIERAADVVAAGAVSVAVIGDLLLGSDPCQRVRDYLRCFSRV